MADSSGSGTGAASSSGSVFSHETDELIASNKVEGTAVYNRQGERVGTLHHFMVGKRSGQVAYAIMSFGGFMGLGEKHYPLPWNELPNGAFVMLDAGPALVLGDSVVPWTPAGYGVARPRPSTALADVLTPPATVAVLRAGYPVQIDASAGREQPGM